MVVKNRLLCLRMWENMTSGLFLFSFFFFFFYHLIYYVLRYLLLVSFFFFFFHPRFLVQFGFGGYGRLGHRDNKDQMTPEAIEMFAQPPPSEAETSSLVGGRRAVLRARYVTCGSTSTFIVAGKPYNTTYMCGITKKTGEVH